MKTVTTARAPLRLWLAWSTLGCMAAMCFGCQPKQVIKAQLAHCPSGYIWKDIVRRAPYLVARMERLHGEVKNRLLKAKQEAKIYQVTCLQDQWKESASLLLLARRYNVELQNAIWSNHTKQMARHYAQLAIVDARQRKMAIRSANCQGKQRYESADKRTVVEVTPAPCP